MKKTLILGTNSNISNTEIIDASRSMGVATVFTDYFYPQDSLLKHYADEYWNVSTADIDVLVQKCREEGITGVYGETDFAQDVALELAERLGLPSYCDKASWHYSRDKVAFKAMCRKHGVPVAEDAVIGAGDVTASSPIGYPVVVKPPDGTGNRGISYCYSDADYAPAVEEALAKSENGQVIVEQMLSGRLYGSNYVLKNGEANLLFIDSMLSQPGTLENRYTLNSTIIEPDMLKKFLEEVNPRIIEMLSGMGCRDGYAWVQLMSDVQDNLYALEMGHRLPGSLIWMPMKDLTDFDSAEWMAHYAAYGNNDDLIMPEAQKEPFKACACGYILWTGKAGVVAKVYGLDRIRNELHAAAHVATPVGRLVAAGEKSVIVAFSAVGCDEMCRKIRFVNEHVSLVDETGEDLLTRFDDFETLQAMYSGS